MKQSKNKKKDNEKNQKRQQTSNTIRMSDPEARKLIEELELKFKKHQKKNDNQQKLEFITKQIRKTKCYKKYKQRNDNYPEILLKHLTIDDELVNCFYNILRNKQKKIYESKYYTYIQIMKKEIIANLNYLWFAVKNIAIKTFWESLVLSKPTPTNVTLLKMACTQLQNANDGDNIFETAYLGYIFDILQEPPKAASTHQQNLYKVIKSILSIHLLKYGETRSKLTSSRTKMAYNELINVKKCTEKQTMIVNALKILCKILDKKNYTKRATIYFQKMVCSHNYILYILKK